MACLIVTERPVDTPIVELRSAAMTSVVPPIPIGKLGCRGRWWGREAHVTHPRSSDWRQKMASEKYKIHARVFSALLLSFLPRPRRSERECAWSQWSLFRAAQSVAEAPLTWSCSSASSAQTNIATPAARTHTFVTFRVSEGCVWHVPVAETTKTRVCRRKIDDHRAGMNASVAVLEWCSFISPRRVVSLRVTRPSRPPLAWRCGTCVRVEAST